jgi:GNAT superfamily N-acetyltransferase
VVSDLTVRRARPGEAAALTALCIRSKAHWGYDADFMRRSRASLTVSDADIADGGVLVAEREGLLFGVARVEPDGELGLMFVDPKAINRGVGRILFDAAAALARSLGAQRMPILADPNAAPFYERMGARLVGHAPSDAIPGRTLPLYEYDLTPEDASGRRPRRDLPLP